MLGRRWRQRCPICRAEPGPDCSVAGATTRTARKREKREWLRESGMTSLARMTGVVQ